MEEILHSVEVCGFPNDDQLVPKCNFVITVVSNTFKYSIINLLHIINITSNIYEKQGAIYVNQLYMQSCYSNIIMP